MIKLLGGLLVVIASSCLGCLQANKYINRVRELKELKTAFHLLQTEIMYAATPLPQALDKVANKITEPLSHLFKSCQQNLTTQLGVTATKAWQIALESHFDKTALGANVEQILINFGQNLGASDRKHQEKNLTLVQQELELAIEQAVDLKQGNVKKWRYFGVLGGLLVVILLY
ncbi:MAG: stage III sporulation protein SpoIIIAB [Bacillota bacterium]